MAITLRDVAIRAGVSRSAVSRTFTKGASVSPAMRARVQRAAHDLGYSPNLIARGLTTRRTELIGLVADNFRNPIFLEIFDLFTRGLQDRGLRPLLVNLSEQTDPASPLEMLRAYSVDGVVVASSTLPPVFAEAFSAAGVPVVHAFGRPSARPTVPIIGIDNRDCGRLAAETLAARGYRRLGFLGGPETATSTEDRLAGFRAGVANQPGCGLQVDFAGAYSFDAGRLEMARLLRRGNPAEAYFCGDDVLSIGALSAIGDAGIAVPEGIGILGLNDMEMAGWANIALTTIRQPIPEIVEAAIDRVARLLTAPKTPPDMRLFPCEVVERATLRPPPPG